MFAIGDMPQNKMSTSVVNKDTTLTLISSQFLSLCLATPQSTYTYPKRIILAEIFDLEEEYKPYGYLGSKELLV